MDEKKDNRRRREHEESSFNFPDKLDLSEESEEIKKEEQTKNKKRSGGFMADIKEKDLILAPNEFAFILDTTTGNVDVYTGPFKKSLAGTDQPMVLNDEGVFERCSSVLDAIQICPVADERSYIVLENPAINENEKHPKPGTSNATVKLDFGAKVNIKGPNKFPLWPEQVANVIRGHNLRSNQYLLVQVYNEKAAKENWTQAVMKSTDGSDKTVTEKKKIPELTTGQLLIIKGTEVAFYIPPTGIEVLQDEDENYVREAVTLERLEYSILLDESGDKRYVKGPDVVFPEPTEKFIEKDGNVKLKALELTEISGIYVKVIADYEEDGKNYKAGDELFITGNEQKIYYPRAEHALIKYGEESVVQYAIAIPKGEARYVLNRITGDVSLVKGPKMFLPDPRKEVLVKRVLSEKECELWFPGNVKVLKYNRNLKSLKSDEYIEEQSIKGFDQQLYSKSVAYATRGAPLGSAGDFGDFGDKMERKTKFTSPRTLTLDSKYDGSILINVWPGFAVQLVSNTGEREVVIGPKSILLEYDQTLEVMELSTGRPKTDDSILSTVYLRINNNRISDFVDITTEDLVNVRIRTNYRVNFEGDPNLWFSTENYVKLLTQHCRSMIRNRMKKCKIEEVNCDAANIIRDCILGSHKTETTKEKSKRPGRVFEENGMKIYDVEVLDITISDDEISELLRDTQHNIVKSSISVTEKQKELEATKEIEKNDQEIEKLRDETDKLKIKLESERNLLETTNDKKEIVAVNENRVLKRENDKKDLELKKEKDEQELSIKKDEVGLYTDAFVNKLKAIQPKLVEALIASGKNELATKLAENLPKANGELGHLLGIGGIASLINSVKGTPMEDALTSLLEIPNEEVTEK